MKFIIDAELKQALLNYLALRPYHEVYQLIDRLDATPRQPQQDKPDGEGC